MIILAIILSMIIFSLFYNFKKVNEKYNRTIHTLNYNQKFIAEQEVKIKEQEQIRIKLVEKNTSLSSKLENKEDELCKFSAEIVILNNTIDEITKISNEVGVELITAENLQDGDVAYGLSTHSFTCYYFNNDKLYYFDGSAAKMKVTDYIIFVKINKNELRANLFDEKVNELKPQKYIEHLKKKFASNK